MVLKYITCFIAVCKTNCVYGNSSTLENSFVEKSTCAFLVLGVMRLFRRDEVRLDMVHPGVASPLREHVDGVLAAPRQVDVEPGVAAVDGPRDRLRQPRLVDVVRADLAEQLDAVLRAGERQVDLSVDRPDETVRVAGRAHTEWIRQRTFAEDAWIERDAWNMQNAPVRLRLPSTAF